MMSYGMSVYTPSNFCDVLVMYQIINKIQNIYSSVLYIQWSIIKYLQLKFSVPSRWSSKRSRLGYVRGRIFINLFGIFVVYIYAF
jgi:hypothetical protein